MAVDVSTEAVRCATQNVYRCGADEQVVVVQGNWFDPLTEHKVLVLAFL